MKTSDFKYKAGQVWNYETRSQEPQSTFTVLKVEPSAKFGSIVHISVTGLRMKNPRAKGGFSDSIGHMPFAEVAINGSASKLVQENVTLPDYHDGYNQWKTAYDKGQAGIFSITIDEAVNVMEEAFKQK